MLRWFFSDLSKAAVNSLYCAIVRPHTEYVIEANSPARGADINQLEGVQRPETRLIIGRRHMPYERRLRYFNLFSLERSRLRADLIMAVKSFKGDVDLSRSDFILCPPRGHIYRLR